MPLGIGQWPSSAYSRGTWSAWEWLSSPQIWTLEVSYFTGAISRPKRKGITIYRAILYCQQFSALYIDIYSGIFLKPFLKINYSFLIIPHRGAVRLPALIIAPLFLSFVSKLPILFFFCSRVNTPGSLSSSNPLCFRGQFSEFTEQLNKSLIIFHDNKGK